MKMVYLTFIFLALKSNLFATNPKITIFTEQYPPYNMKDKNGISGISVEVVDAILNQIGSKQTKNDIIVTNWSRAYKLAQKKKNTMVFSTMRTKAREPLFKWVGPIAPTTKNIIALKEKNIKINSIDDLKKYTIGTVLRDSAEELLLSLGVNKENLKPVSGKESLKLTFRKIQNNRIDMFAYNSNVAKYYAKKNNIDWNRYEIVFTMVKTDVYLAFNKNTDDKVINKWQKGLDKIKENGIYKSILEKY